MLQKETLAESTVGVCSVRLWRVRMSPDVLQHGTLLISATCWGTAGSVGVVESFFIFPTHRLSTVRWLFCFFCLRDCVRCSPRFSSWLLSWVTSSPHCSLTGTWFSVMLGCVCPYCTRIQALLSWVYFFRLWTTSAFVTLRGKQNPQQPKTNTLHWDDVMHIRFAF